MKVTRNGNRVKVVLNAADPAELESFLNAVGSLPSGFSLPNDLVADLKTLQSSPLSMASLLAFAEKHPGPFDRD